MNFVFFLLSSFRCDLEMIQLVASWAMKNDQFLLSALNIGGMVQWMCDSNLHAVSWSFSKSIYELRSWEITKKKDIQNQWPGWNNWKLRFVLVLCTNCVGFLCSLDNFKKFQAWVTNSSSPLDISRNSSPRIEKLSTTATLKYSRTPGKKVKRSMISDTTRESPSHV